MSTFDLYHDAGHARLSHVLGVMPNLTHYLGTAKIAADDDGSHLPDSSFADSARRLFPIHTPKMAALSMGYAKAAQMDGVVIPGPVMDTLKLAMDAYGIPDGMFEVARVEEKTASAEDFLFPEQRLYPIRNADEVKTAELQLNAQRTKLLPQSRVAAYVRLYEKAASLGVDVSSTTMKYAGLTETDVKKLVDCIKARSGAVKEANLQGDYERFATSVRKSKGALRSRANQVKVAQLLADMDEKAGLVSLYDRGIPDPMESVFNTTKTAEPGVDLGEVTVPMTKLMSLDPRFYGDVLGDDFLPDLTTRGQLDHTKMAEVLPTLPRDMKIALASALKSAGVK